MFQVKLGPDIPIPAGTLLMFKPQERDGEFGDNESNTAGKNNNVKFIL